MKTMHSVFRITLGTLILALGLFFLVGTAISTASHVKTGMFSEFNHIREADYFGFAVGAVVSAAALFVLFRSPRR